MSMPSHYHDYCYFSSCISLPRVKAALPFANSKTPISSREAPSRSHTCWSLREARVALQWLLLPSVPRTESLTQYLSSINFFFYFFKKSFGPANKAPSQKFLILFRQSWGAAKERAWPPLVEHTTPQTVPLIGQQTWSGHLIQQKCLSLIVLKKTSTQFYCGARSGGKKMWSRHL